MRDVQAARGTALSRPRSLLVLLALNTVVLDAATKAVVVERLEHRAPVRLLGDLLVLEVSRNSGAAFSFAQGATVLLTLIAAAVVVVIVRTLPRLRSTGWAVTLGLLLGGAAGNLVDRLLRAPGVGRGAVVDFIHPSHFASFNIADSAITIGALLAVLLSLRGIEVDGSHRTPGRHPGTMDG
ncbi:MAG TPA: signal peptidase II [Mycobacteriales bacterium]|nr:signal peptidase II [Mycobacteriales bacterium]